MPRPRKQTVDFFPHYCIHGKTMFILEQRYGNDGYAFWFKLLEMLGSTDGHYLDMNDPATWEYLQAKTRVDGGFCDEILHLLAKLHAIDPELWSERIIWSENFVSNVSEVYRNRRVDLPQKPSFQHRKPPLKDVSTCRNTGEEPFSDVSTEKNPQSRVEESRVEENKESTCAPPPPEAPPEPETEPTEHDLASPPKGGNGHSRKIIYSKEFEEFYSHYPRRTAKARAFKTWQNLRQRGRLPPLVVLLAAVNEQRMWKQWRDGIVPHPATWLNGEQWADEKPPEPQLNDRPAW